jgi:hypothetical protein
MIATSATSQKFENNNNNNNKTLGLHKFRWFRLSGRMVQLGLSSWGEKKGKASGSQLGCALNPKPYKERRMSLSIVLWLFCSYSLFAMKVTQTKVHVQEI